MGWAVGNRMRMTIMIGDVKLQSPCMTQWVQRYEVGPLQWPTQHPAACKYHPWGGGGCAARAANLLELGIKQRATEPRAKSRQLLPCLSNCQCPKVLSLHRCATFDRCCCTSSLVQFSAVQCCPRFFEKGASKGVGHWQGRVPASHSTATQAHTAHSLMLPSKKKKGGMGRNFARRRARKLGSGQGIFLEGRMAHLQMVLCSRLLALRTGNHCIQAGCYLRTGYGCAHLVMIGWPPF